MYFANAVWYLLSTIGFVSIIVFAGAALNIFNSAAVEAEIGYRNYFIIVGGYVLIALPLAATINGGTGGNYFFHLGWICVPFGVLSHQLETHYKALRAQLIAQAHAAIAPPLVSPQTIDLTAQPAGSPAPARASVFDVPAQR